MAKELTEAPVEPVEEETGRKQDPELLSLGRMLRMLADLDDDARGRCVAYLTSRYPDRRNWPAGS